jgi:hypothetical protein
MIHTLASDSCSFADTVREELKISDEFKMLLTSPSAAPTRPPSRTLSAHRERPLATTWLCTPGPEHACRTTVIAAPASRTT